MLYTALGDSITAGEAATSWTKAYPSLVVSMLNTRSAPITGQVLAEPGWTSRALENAVLANSSVYLTEARTISIWVGGDDLADAALSVLRGAPRRVIQESIVRYGKDVARLIAAIRSVSKACIIVCNQYNPFPNSPIAAQGIGALNAATAQVAARMGAVLAPTAAWFEGRQAELIYGYRRGRIEDVMTSPVAPVHPNNRGHLVIARNLAPMIR